MGRTSVKGQIEARYGKPVKTVLTGLASKLDYKGITAELGVSQRTVYNLLAEFKLEPQKTSAGLGEKGEIPTSELSRLIESYLTEKQFQQQSARTIERYRSDLQKLLWWYAQQGIDASLKNLTSENIQQFIIYLQTTPIRWGGITQKLVKKSTINLFFKEIKAFCNWLEFKKHLTADANPTRLMKNPQVDKVIIPKVPGANLRQMDSSFNNSFEGIRNKAIFRLFQSTGVRLDELTNLAREAVSMDRKLLKVFGKGSKEREIPLCRTTLEALDAYLQKRADKQSKWLWQTVDGRRLERYGIKEVVKGLKRFYPALTPHVFRHTWAINYLLDGGNPIALKVLGGWADLNMVDLYVQASKAEIAVKDYSRVSVFDKLLEPEKAEAKPDLEKPSSESEAVELIRELITAYKIDVNSL